MHEDNFGVYGARKVRLQLNREGIPVARRAAARLMRDLGLRGVKRGGFKKTAAADESAPGPVDLVNRSFTAARPDELRVADITCIAAWPGFVYAAFVTDVFSRRIIGRRASRPLPPGSRSRCPRDGGAGARQGRGWRDSS